MKPFDLQRAIVGDPLLTREGKTARFVAHLPECDNNYRVIAIVAGDGAATAYGEDGRMWRGEDRHNDLMMAPKKRTVFANVWRDGLQIVCHDDPWMAGEAANFNGRENYCAIAAPIEIED